MQAVAKVEARADITALKNWEEQSNLGMFQSVLIVVCRKEVLGCPLKENGSCAFDWGHSFAERVLHCSLSVARMWAQPQNL